MRPIKGPFYKSRDIGEKTGCTSRLKGEGRKGEAGDQLFRQQSGWEKKQNINTI
jgi:hypothetical protein